MFSFLFAIFLILVCRHMGKKIAYQKRQILSLITLCKLYEKLCLSMIQHGENPDVETEIWVKNELQKIEREMKQ